MSRLICGMKVDKRIYKQKIILFVLVFFLLLLLPEYSARQVWANSVNRDQTGPEGAF